MGFAQGELVILGMFTKAWPGCFSFRNCLSIGRYEYCKHFGVDTPAEWRNRWRGTAPVLQDLTVSLRSMTMQQARQGRVQAAKKAQRGKSLLLKKVSGRECHDRLLQEELESARWKEALRKDIPGRRDSWAIVRNSERV